jgi:DNA-binding response OmpR family regulator
MESRRQKEEIEDDRKPKAENRQKIRKTRPERSARMSRILIIEDEESIAELEKDYLELSGFEVEIETDGTRGLQRALDEDFNLYVLDLMLPGTDGFEICRRIRESKDAPVLMVSARKDDIDKIRGLGLGADDYITKPFSPSELVARVKAHISRYDRLIGSSASKNDVIEIRNLKIDKTARRVFVNGEEKNFTTKEFDLLTFLASNPNHVYTKEDLFRNIWNMESVGDIATVTVHIKKIREKIELDTSKPQYIETIWGVGYRFKI